MVSIRPNLYGFPRGKIEPGEKLEEAARREILEETGYDCGDLVGGNHHSSSYICNRNGASMKLYFVENVPENHDFVAECSYEICGHWFVPLDEIDDQGRFRGICGNIFTRGVRSCFPDVKAFCRRKRDGLWLPVAVDSKPLVSMMVPSEVESILIEELRRSRRSYDGRQMNRKLPVLPPGEKRNSRVFKMREDGGEKIKRRRTALVDLDKNQPCGNPFKADRCQKRREDTEMELRANNSVVESVPPDYSTIGQWRPVFESVTKLTEEQLLKRTRNRRSAMEKKRLKKEQKKCSSRQEDNHVEFKRHSNRPCMEALKILLQKYCKQQQ